MRGLNSSMLWVRKLGEYNHNFCCYMYIFCGFTKFVLAFYFHDSANVTMTDLPEVMPLLQKNVDANQAVWRSCGGKVSTQVLQWGSEIQDWKTPDVLVLADCVYYMEV